MERKKSHRGFQEEAKPPLIPQYFLTRLFFKAEKALVMEDDWSCTAASSPPTSAYSLPTPLPAPPSPLHRTSTSTATHHLPTFPARLPSAVFLRFSLLLATDWGKVRHTL